MTAETGPVSPASAELNASARAEVLEALPFGVMTFTRERAVVYVNAAATRLVFPIRLRRGEVIESDSPLAVLVAPLFGRSGTVTNDVRLGKRILRATTIPPVRNRPALVVLEDVSSRSRRERAQREFVANAAHELLGPVTAIGAAVHVLQTPAGQAPDVRDRFVGHVADAADRLARSARALLLLARAQSGEQPPRLELIPLRPLLEEAAARDATISCPRDTAVLVDRELLLLALRNVVENAHRHSEGGVAVEGRDQSDGSVVIEVRDAGRGMSAERLDRVATRFFSGEGRDSGGYGLGIAIAAQSAEVMGGALEVHSEAGLGTRVSLRFASGKVLRR